MAWLTVPGAQYITASTASQQGQAPVCHISPTVRKQKEMNATATVAFSFLFQDLSPWNGDTPNYSESNHLN